MPASCEDYKNVPSELPERKGSVGALVGAARDFDTNGH